MIYSITNCFGCNSHLAPIGRYKQCDQCDIKYAVVFRDTFFEFLVRHNSNTYRVEISIDDPYFYTKIYQLDNISFKYFEFYKVDKVLEMPFQEWSGFINKLDKLQAFH